MKARFFVVAGLAAAVGLTGCTSTKMLQRNDCWIRQTKKWPARYSEEIGPCARPAPQWASDRLTRVVQECVVQADYRWQNMALAAWSRGQPLPERQSEQQISEACLAHASAVVAAENDAEKARVTAENGALKERLGDLNADREKLREHSGQLATALGETALEAAKRPDPSAVATATAHGDGSSTTTHESATETVSSPGLAVAPTPVVTPTPVVVQTPAAAPASARSSSSTRSTPVACTPPTVQARRTQTKRPAATPAPAACAPVKPDTAAQPAPAPLPAAATVTPAAGEAAAKPATLEDAVPVDTVRPPLLPAAPAEGAERG